MVAVLKVIWYLSWGIKSAHRKCWLHLRKCWLHAEVLILAWLKTKIVDCKKFVEVKKKIAGPEWTQFRMTPVAMQPRDINWSCEIRELRSIRCFEFSFLVFPFHSKCEWLTFTVLLSLQWREVEAEQIDVAKVLVKNYTCKCLRWFPVFSFLLVFRSNFKWSNAGFVARLRCMDSSAVHRAVLKYIVGTTWSLLSAISRR
jgi:hypothetical protein